MTKEKAIYQVPADQVEREALALAHVVRLDIPDRPEEAAKLKEAAVKLNPWLSAAARVISDHPAATLANLWSILDGPVMAQDKSLLEGNGITLAALESADLDKAREAYDKALDLTEENRKRAELERARQAIKAGTEAGDLESIDRTLNRVADIVTTARAGVRINSYQTEDKDAGGFLETLAGRRDDGRTWLGLDSGLPYFNEVFNGLTPGLFILSGAPSTGKTTLAKQIADQVAQTEKVPVLFWSFEQSKEELRIKSLSRMASVDSRKIWKGRTGADKWADIEAAYNTYIEGPGRWLSIIEGERTDTMDRIKDVSRWAKRRAGDRQILVVIDYLQIIPGGKEAPDTIREKVDWLLSELRRLSREIDSPILVLSSQNRAAYKNNEKPTLAAMKESGGIEYSADGVICLWRNAEKTKAMTYNQPTIRVEARVLKNRNGELASINLDFTPAWSLFRESGKESLEVDQALGGDS